MTALTAGAKAPDVNLPAVDGNNFSLANANGPVVLAFFKISCPICQYSFPYFDRLHKAHPNVAFFGVSQDSRKDTESFIRQYGVTFPVLLEDTKSFVVSNAYGLSNVPTLFLVEDGEVKFSSVGWAKDDVLKLHEMLSQSSAPAPLFKPNEQVAAFKAG